MNKPEFNFQTVASALPSGRIIENATIIVPTDGGWKDRRKPALALVDGVVYHLGRNHQQPLIGTRSSSIERRAAAQLLKIKRTDMHKAHVELSAYEAENTMIEHLEQLRSQALAAGYDLVRRTPKY